MCEREEKGGTGKKEREKDGEGRRRGRMKECAGSAARDSAGRWPRGPARPRGAADCAPRAGAQDAGRARRSPFSMRVSMSRSMPRK